MNISSCGGQSASIFSIRYFRDICNLFFSCKLSDLFQKIWPGVALNNMTLNQNDTFDFRSKELEINPNIVCIWNNHTPKWSKVPIDLVVASHQSFWQSWVKKTHACLSILLSQKYLHYCEIHGGLLKLNKRHDF